MRNVAAPLGQRIIRTRIDRRGAGMALGDYLAGRFNYRTFDEWLVRIADGQILLNGALSEPGRRLAEGDEISYCPTDLAEPPVDPAWRIVHEDEFLLVIEKSGNLPVHPAGPFYRHTLWYLLTERFGTIHPVNRLDRETSGLLLAAKTAEAARRLGRCEFRKVYLARVFGNFDRPVDAAGFLVADAGSAVRKKRRFVTSPAGFPGKAESARTLLEPAGFDGRCSLVRALPCTGRLHQIRCTLWSLGFPLLGDKLYGPDENFYLKQRTDALTDRDRQLLVLPRQALHSSELSFRHPFTGEELHCRSPLPADFGL